jgi:hypothetical protein
VEHSTFQQQAESHSIQRKRQAKTAEHEAIKKGRSPKKERK